MAAKEYHSQKEYEAVQTEIDKIKLTDSNCTIMSYIWGGKRDSMYKEDKDKFEKEFSTTLEREVSDWADKGHVVLSIFFTWKDIWHVWKQNYPTIGDFAEYMRGRGK